MKLIQLLRQPGTMNYEPFSRTSLQFETMKLTMQRLGLFVLGAFIVCSCYYDQVPSGASCTSTDLKVTLVSKLDATSCKSIDGQVVVEGAGGTPPYDYKLGDGIYQTNPTFGLLGSGLYSITVKDAKGCKSSMEVDVGAANSNLSAAATSTPDSQCEAPHNGTIPFMVLHISFLLLHHPPNNQSTRSRDPLGLAQSQLAYCGLLCAP